MRAGASRLIGVALGVAVLAGCAPEPDEVDETPTPSTAPSTVITPTPEPEPVQFRMPEQCAEIVTAETASEFAEDGLDLLGGPGGVYGENYFSEPTPEERVGGITCVWGDEEVQASTVIVSVAPMSASTQSDIVRALIDSGLIESQVDGVLTYARLGDDVSTPAELHSIRADSWISVIEAVGGEARFDRATQLLDEVVGQVYR